MTTLHDRDEQGKSAAPTEGTPAVGATDRNPYKIDFVRTGADRRDFRRHDLEQQSINVSRWAESNREPQRFGRLVDLSASGVRIRTPKTQVQPDGRIRLRLELPAYAGISPFIDATDSADPRPTREWVGHLEIARVRPVAGRDEVEVAGRLVDMADHDRGMLGLYLSTQPLAA
jgi:hypothetical protein